MDQLNSHNGIELSKIDIIKGDVFSILSDIFNGIDIIEDIHKKADNDVILYIEKILLKDVQVNQLTDNRYHFISNRYGADLFVNRSNSNSYSLYAKSLYIISGILSFKIEDVLSDVRDTIVNIIDFYRLYREYDNNTTSRDNIIDFGRRYPFVPFDHIYYADNATNYHYMDDNGYLRDKDHNVVDTFIYIPRSFEKSNWELYNDKDSWLRRRKQGGWLHGWSILGFKGWFYEITGAYDDKHKFGDY